MPPAKNFTCHVSNYGLQEIYKGYETHNSICRKCEIELHHPLGVSFQVCGRCGNKSYAVRWTHIEDMVQKGNCSFRVSAKSIEKLRESVRLKLIDKKVLYEDWTEASVIEKKK
jgi:hypothetical protein